MTIFERKGHEAVAKVIENVWNDRDPGIESEAVAHKLADVFSLDNPNFNRARFLKACGMEDEVQSETFTRGIDELDRGNDLKTYGISTRDHVNKIHVYGDLALRDRILQLLKENPT